MHRQRRLAALFVVLALTGCAPLGSRAGTVAERALSTSRPARHQRDALTESRTASRYLGARDGRPIGSRSRRGYPAERVQFFPSV
jgi:hypothetical protein